MRYYADPLREMVFLFALPLGEVRVNDSSAAWKDVQGAGEHLKDLTAQ